MPLRAPPDSFPGGEWILSKISFGCKSPCIAINLQLKPLIARTSGILDVRYTAKLDPCNPPVLHNPGKRPGNYPLIHRNGFGQMLAFRYLINVKEEIRKLSSPSSTELARCTLVKNSATVLPRRFERRRDEQ